jgi:hypothetical protein
MGCARGRARVWLALWLAALGCDEGTTAPGTGSRAPRFPVDGARPLDAGRFGADASAPRQWPGCEALVAADDAGAEGQCIFDGNHGVYVDAQRGDDARGDGSRDRPFASLGAGIVSAAARSTRVFVCGGEYRESVAFGSASAGVVGLYGSLSCASFLPEPGAPRTRIVAVPGRQALRVEAAGPLRIEHLDFEASDATGLPPGASFNAAFVSGAEGVVLHDVTLQAAAGQPAPAASTLAGSAPAGLPGLDGVAACVRNPNLGGLSVSTAGCASAGQPGGSGGSGGVGTGDGGSGLISGSAAPSGETAAGAWGCAAGEAGQGQPGFDGFAGNVGRGARGFGALIGGRFVGFAGQAGGSGGNGAPGWGGGGARAPLSCPGMATPTGASGGSGGSGGCGGAGGPGGAAGGSSIALIAVDSALTLDGVRLLHGAGGDGGEGAVGQLGGAAAEGGKGGQGAGGSRAACDGAASGKGGAGGPGGGGNGGHALGLLYAGPRPTWHGVEGPANATAILGGAPGLGGFRDPSFPEIYDGRAGLSALELEL